MRLVIISGHSGSGKTSALNILEDIGFTCIDNLPVSLLQNLISQLDSSEKTEGLNIAIGIDARNIAGDLDKIPQMLEEIEAGGVSVTVVFLHAQRANLSRRFSETRRRHPLSNDGVSLKDAIDLEKKLLSPIFDIADRLLTPQV